MRRRARPSLRSSRVTPGGSISPGPVACKSLAADSAGASACRAYQLALWTDSVRRGDTAHALWSPAASQRLGGAWQSAHRGGG